MAEILQFPVYEPGNIINLPIPAEQADIAASRIGPPSGHPGLTWQGARRMAADERAAMVERLATHPEHPTITTYGNSRELRLPSFNTGARLRQAVLSHKEEVVLTTVLAATVLYGGLSLARAALALDSSHPALPRVEKEVGASGHFLREDPIFLTPDAYVGMKVSNQLAAYIANDIGARTTEKFTKLGQFLPIGQPVQIIVKEPKGIKIRDFPDEKFGRWVRTNLADGQPQYEALQFDPQNPIEGTYRYFMGTAELGSAPNILGVDPSSLDVWLIFWSNSQDQKIKYARIRELGKWLVDFVFETEKGEIVRVNPDQIFGRYHPQLILTDVYPTTL